MKAQKGEGVVEVQIYTFFIIIIIIIIITTIIIIYCNWVFTRWQRSLH